MSRRFVTPELFAFLTELKQNNDRDWFTVNRQRYEDWVRSPLLDFIRAFDFRLKGISRNYVADPAKTGGSLFRIQRDIRFSNDKSPYKTHAGIQFRHRRGKDAHAPGFYLHLEPGGCFFAMGMWRPDPASQRQVRQAILADPHSWSRIKEDPDFKAAFYWDGETFKRPPKGIPLDHPLLGDLLRKDFVIVEDVSEADALAEDFLDHFTASCQTAGPLMRFLTLAVGLEW